MHETYKIWVANHNPQRTESDLASYLKAGSDVKMEEGFSIPERKAVAPYLIWSCSLQKGENIDHPAIRNSGEQPVTAQVTETPLQFWPGALWKPDRDNHKLLNNEN